MLDCTMGPKILVEGQVGQQHSERFQLFIYLFIFFNEDIITTLSHRVKRAINVWTNMDFPERIDSHSSRHLYRILEIIVQQVMVV